MAIQEIRAKNMRWIDLTNAKKINCPEIKFLKKNYHFHPINLEDCIVDGQRPKIDSYRDHLFLVMLYPQYNRKTGVIEEKEVDFFVHKNYLITVHDSKLPTLVHFFNHLKKTKHYREKNEFLSNNIIIILYELHNRLLSHCFPMLDHISLDIKHAEKNIFCGKEKEMVKDILASRRNIVTFRKTLAAHKNIYKKLQHANRDIKFFDPLKSDVYFNSLIDKAKDIWDSLESFKESIEAIHETNESLISFRLNQIMKTFTIISVVIFLLTLTATLLSIGAPGTPIVDWPLGFWIIILLEIFIANLVLFIFKRKKWLE